MSKDIFISYKNDGEGNNFAKRLFDDLDKRGYSVYFNPNEQHAGCFPDRLKKAVEGCRDFLLIVSQACLNQLIEHNKVDWVREELLTAYRNDKKIIPLLMPGVAMPKDKDVMPDDIAFLPDKDAIVMTDVYDRSPLDFLLSWMDSKAEKADRFKDEYNGSKRKSIDADFKLSVDGSADGNFQDMFEAANYYYYGFIGEGKKGCRRDFSEAYRLLKILSESDNEYTAYANSLIAEMHFNGTVPRKPQSYEIALEYHEKAKDKSGFSAREAAYLKSRGCGCEFDYEETEKSYLEAVARGDSVAVVGLAKFYTSYGQFDKAAELYRKTSDIVPDAEYCLGMLYRNGVLENPPRPDFFRAAFYFQHAIDSGKCGAEVYHQLGRLYFTPTGDFPKDFRAAESNFRIAADMGHKEAQYKLGLMYEYGYVERNVNKAIYYHSLAAGQGVSFAAYHLALLYQEPEQKNYQKAYENALAAAKKGVMESEFLLGVFLLYGRGCTADEDEAYRYFSMAYSHGMQIAKIMMDKISNGQE